MRKREWVYKFESGEYLREWRGFSPFWMGCFYGDSVVLGGEEEFSHCYDFFSGIGDVEWWITEEIEKLTEEQKERMYSILVRNKSVDDMLSDRGDITDIICDTLDIGFEYVYRLGNKLRKELVESDNPVEKYKEFLNDEEIVKRLSFDNETYRKLTISKLIVDTKSMKYVWYLEGSRLKSLRVHKDTIQLMKSKGVDEDDVLLKEELEELLDIVL
jgi:hypothetical protein